MEYDGDTEFCRGTVPNQPPTDGRTPSNWSRNLTPTHAHSAKKYCHSPSSRLGANRLKQKCGGYQRLPTFGISCNNLDVVHMCANIVVSIFLLSFSHPDVTIKTSREESERKKSTK